MVCLVLAGAAWASYRVLGADLVAVPDVAGLSEADADTALGDAGLRVHVAAFTVDAVGPPGRVLEQRPTPGELVERGTTVAVVVSVAPQRVTLPDLRGMGFEEARDALVALGLRVAVERTATETTGTLVVAMSPAPGSAVVPGSDVTLLIPDPATDGGLLLPSDLTGMTLILDVAPRAADTEGDPALDVARRLRGLLEASGAVVVSTRSTTDADPSPDERAQLAEVTSAAVFVGLDIVPEGRGITVMLTYSDAAGARVRSLALAESLVRSLRAVDIDVDAPVPAADPVLAAFDGPGVRCGLPAEAVRTVEGGGTDPAWADTVARALYRGVAGVVAAWR